MEILKKHLKKIIVAIIVLVIGIIILTSQKNSKIQGSWIAKYSNGRVVCFDFDGNEFAYLLDNGGTLYGKFKIKKDCIYLTDYKGNEFIYKFKKEKNKLIIAANNGEYVLEKNNKKVNEKNLTKYRWDVDGTSQELVFNKKKKIVQATNSSGKVSEMKYEVVGCNNELLKIGYEGEYTFYYIECEKDELKLYINLDLNSPYIYDGKK